MSYQRALELPGNHGAVHTALAVTLTKAGRFDEAIDHMQQAIDINPQHADVAALLADDLNGNADATKRHHADKLAELASAL